MIARDLDLTIPCVLPTGVVGLNLLSRNPGDAEELPAQVTRNLELLSISHIVSALHPQLHGVPQIPWFRRGDLTEQELKLLNGPSGQLGWFLQLIAGRLAAHPGISAVKLWVTGQMPDGMRILRINGFTRKLQAFLKSEAQVFIAPLGNEDPAYLSGRGITTTYVNEIRPVVVWNTRQLGEWIQDGTPRSLPDKTMVFASNALDLGQALWPADDLKVSAQPIPVPVRDQRMRAAMLHIRMFVEAAWRWAFDEFPKRDASGIDARIIAPAHVGDLSLGVQVHFREANDGPGVRSGNGVDVMQRPA